MTRFSGEIRSFRSCGSKVASALVLFRLLEVAAQSPSVTAARWVNVVGVLSALSMVVGNLLALAQTDLKRMLAYSGVAHMGYLLLALVTWLGPERKGVAFAGQKIESELGTES